MLGWRSRWCDEEQVAHVLRLEACLSKGIAHRRSPRSTATSTHTSLRRAKEASSLYRSIGTAR